MRAARSARPARPTPTVSPASAMSTPASAWPATCPTARSAPTAGNAPRSSCCPPEGVCKPPANVSAACVVDDDCCGTDICSGSVCFSCANPNQFCFNNIECCSGTCNNNGPGTQGACADYDTTCGTTTCAHQECMDTICDAVNSTCSYVPTSNGIDCGTSGFATCQEGSAPSSATPRGSSATLPTSAVTRATSVTLRRSNQSNAARRRRAKCALPRTWTSTRRPCPRGAGRTGPGPRQKRVDANDR